MLMTTGRHKDSLAQPWETEHERRTTEVLEGSGDIARLIRPESDRSSPRIGIRITALDVLRDLVPLEPPDGNVIVVPKRGEYTTSHHVERMTSASLGVREGATIVVTARTQALS